MIRQCIQHDRESQRVGPHDEDEEEDLHKADDFASPWSKQNFTCVGHAVDARMSELELPKKPSRISRKGSHPKD